MILSNTVYFLQFVVILVRLDCVKDLYGYGFIQKVKVAFDRRFGHCK